MTKRVQHIRHDETGANAFTGRVGEFTWDTTNGEIRGHDGSTAGGIRVARRDLANVPNATPSTAGKMSATDKTKLDGLPTSAVSTAREVTGTGYLTGGGDLSANRALDIAAAIKTIIDNAAALITEISVNGNQHAVEALGTLSSAGTTVDVTVDAVFTATCSAASVIDIAARPDRYWETVILLTNADDVASPDSLFSNTINWLVGEGSYSTTFSDQPITLTATATAVLWGFDDTTIYGAVR